MPHITARSTKNWKNHSPDARLFEKTYKAIKPESIDYALMEKLKEAVMFKAAFAWNDVGSWSSVYEMNAKDLRKNVCRGRAMAIDTRNSLLFSSEKKPLAVIGLDGIAVIDTKDGILIAPMGKLQQVKQVIQILKERKILTFPRAGDQKNRNQGSRTKNNTIRFCQLEISRFFQCHIPNTAPSQKERRQQRRPPA